METNTETKLSLKEKLYQETLDELVTKVWKYKYDKDTPIPSWSKFIEYVGEGGSNKDIEKAVKLAVEKTYDALQSGGLTEAGQSLYDRRKDIEVNTAKRLCAKFDKIIPYHDEWTDGEWTDYNDEEYDAVKKEFGVD